MLNKYLEVLSSGRTQLKFLLLEELDAEVENILVEYDERFKHSMLTFVEYNQEKDLFEAVYEGLTDVLVVYLNRDGKVVDEKYTNYFK